MAALRYPSADLLEAQDWSFPIPIAYGPGRIAELGRVCQETGCKRPLVVTDRGSAGLPFIEQAMTSLRQAGLAPVVFSDVSSNPTDVDVANGRTAFDAGDHDGVVAIGGGSGMDAGKAISLVASTSHDLAAFDFDQPPPVDAAAGGFVPLITVPTTAGTGAETESTAMVTIVERGVKICVWHPMQKPAATILDPELTLGLPPDLTAWTGVDALVHAIEAFCVPGWHPLCDGVALEAMRLIAASLPTAVADGGDLLARSAMLVGSCLAGVSFLKGLGLVHGMSHMIGAVYDTHHGLTNAVLLPPVLHFNRSGIQEKIAPMAQAVGAGDSFDDLMGWTTALLDEVAIPANLGDLGIGSDRLGELADKALLDAATGTNPVTPSHEAIEELLRASLTATR